MEYNDVIALEQDGKLLIGVDRGFARKFYTENSISKIETVTGEAPFFEKTVIWFAFIFGPLALLSSVVFGFLAFKWWGVIGLLFCPILYLIYSSFSARGGSRLIGITLLLLISVGIYFIGIIKNPLAFGFASLFLLALWFNRLLYCSSSFFLRNFVIRNKKAFDYLKIILAFKRID